MQQYTSTQRHLVCILYFSIFFLFKFVLLEGILSPHHVSSALSPQVRMPKSLIYFHCKVSDDLIGWRIDVLSKARNAGGVRMASCAGLYIITNCNMSYVSEKSLWNNQVNSQRMQHSWYCSVLHMRLRSPPIFKFSFFLLLFFFVFSLSDLFHVQEKLLESLMVSTQVNFKLFDSLWSTASCRSIFLPFHSLFQQNIEALVIRIYYI